MLRKSVYLAVILVLLCTQGLGAAEPSPFLQGYTEGYLTSISAGDGGEMTAVIESYSGTRFDFSVHPDAVFMIDNRTVKPSEIRPGMEVYGELQGRQLISLEAYSTAQMGYINPGSKVRKGIVSRIDRDNLEIRSADGRKIAYQLTPGTIILRNGRATTADTIYTGDNVKLFFDEVNSNLISRLKIQGESILIKDLYRAQLASLDEYSNRMTLKNAERFYNGTWQEVQSSYTVSYNRDLTLYYRGQVIPQRSWNYYRGKTVYLISKNLLGRDTIDRIIVKNQYESGFADKITAVNWFTDSFELASKRNITLDPGTIVIKHDRIQDSYTISPHDDAYIVADGSSLSHTADIVYIYNEDINHSSLGQHYLYYGRLDQILDDRIWLQDFEILNQHEWESYDDEKELYYDLDSSLFDMDNGKVLTAAELYAGNYSVDEDEERAEDNDLEDWYAYVYADGDRIAALAVHQEQDSLMGQRITVGSIRLLSEDSLVGWTALLGDSRDWSSRKDEWMPKTADLRINLETAMIIRDGKIISPDELHTGERLYLLRDDFSARVAIVK